MKKLYIGIPTLNEEVSIENVLLKVDKGLETIRAKYHCEIILLDSESTDNTVQVFNRTETITPKEVRVIISAEKGKGKNLLDFFNYCYINQADYLITLDGDLLSIDSDRVAKYVFALENGADLVLPYYNRNKFEGSSTNHLVFPVVYAFTGKYLRQPIAGDFGLSLDLCSFLLKQKHHPDTMKFGIDVFITYSAIYGGFKTQIIYLSEKIHKPSFPNLPIMFPQIVNSLFFQIINYPVSRNDVRYEKLIIQKSIFNKSISSFTHKEKAISMKLNAMETLNGRSFGGPLEVFISKILNKGEIDAEIRTAILIEVFTSTSFDSDDVYLFTEYFKIRVVDFWLQIENKSTLEVEKQIIDQAKLLRKKYLNYLKTLGTTQH